MLSSLLLGCDRPRPNLLVIVSDAFRADALSCDGVNSLTPHLCQLAERGVLFEHAFSAAPWTLPSAVALFTGNSATQYRRVAGGSTEAAGGGLGSFYRVPQDERLFAEVLRDQGYQVEGSVENPIARQAGALRGFTRRSYDQKRNQQILQQLDPRLGFVPRDHRYLRILWALEFLHRAGDTPFALLHWIDDPHAEYRPPPPFLDRAEAGDLPRDTDFYLGLGHHQRPQRGLRKLRRHAPSFTPEEIAFIKELYLLEIASVDERIGYLLTALELSGQADRTFVAFTSDHGEAFGEHGDFLHGVSLYNELVRVPLILAGPGIGPGQRVASPVSVMDLVPTLSELMGVGGLEPVQGRSLLPLLDGDEEPREPRALHLSSPDRLEREAVILGRYKLIAGPGSIELYDYVADPGETRNLVEELPEVRRDLVARLLRIRRENEELWKARIVGDDPAAAEEAFEQTQRALRAVGYLD